MSCSGRNICKPLCESSITTCRHHGQVSQTNHHSLSRTVAGTWSPPTLYYVLSFLQFWPLSLSSLWSFLVPWRRWPQLRIICLADLDLLPLPSLPPSLPGLHSSRSIWTSMWADNREWLPVNKSLIWPSGRNDADGCNLVTLDIKVYIIVVGGLVVSVHGVVLGLCATGLLLL